MNIIRCSWVKRIRSVWLKWKGTEFEISEILRLMRQPEIWHRSWKTYKDCVNKLQVPGGRTQVGVAAGETTCAFRCNVKESKICEIKTCTPTSPSIGQTNFKALLVSKIPTTKHNNKKNYDTPLGIIYYILYYHHGKRVSGHICVSLTHACNLQMPPSY